MIIGRASLRGLIAALVLVAGAGAAGAQSCPASAASAAAAGNAAQHGLQIYMFNMGQADSMLIVGPSPDRKTLLVDLGIPIGGPPPGAGTARDVARRLCEVTGRRHLDYFLLTHFHSDHLGNATSGVRTLIDAEHVTIDTVIDTDTLGTQYVSQADRARVNRNYGDLFAGWLSTGKVHSRVRPQFGADQIRLGGNVRVDILAFAGQYGPGQPSAFEQYQQQHPSYYAQHPASENDLSIAFELSLGNFEFWTAGDLSGADGDGTAPLSGSGNAYTNVELPMVNYWTGIGRETDVEIYRASHHGARYSTTPQLLAALDPEHVLYSAERGYRHPTEATVRNVARTATQYATGLDPSWGDGSRFRTLHGRVVGEIRIMVSPDGSTYTINGDRFRSYSDAEERTNADQDD